MPKTARYIALMICLPLAVACGDDGTPADGGGSESSTGDVSTFTTSTTTNTTLTTTSGADTGSDYALEAPTAWLFGNEAQGLSEAELALADHRVAVPVYGFAESLNLGTAATVCLYASARSQQP